MKKRGVTVRKFGGFYGNESYRVGCNGATIYVYNHSNKELGRFKDLKYGYVDAFQPGTNIFVVRSTEGSLAVYDLEKMELVRKIVITQLGGQDHGFAFSFDGAFFYNIENPVHSTRTRLAVYRTSDFEFSRVYRKTYKWDHFRYQESTVR